MPLCFAESSATRGYIHSCQIRGAIVDAIQPSEPCLLNLPIAGELYQAFAETACKGLQRDFKVLACQHRPQLHQVKSQIDVVAQQCHERGLYHQPHQQQDPEPQTHEWPPEICKVSGGHTLTSGQPQPQLGERGGRSRFPWRLHGLKYEVSPSRAGQVHHCIG